MAFAKAETCNLFISKLIKENKRNFITFLTTRFLVVFKASNFVVWRMDGGYRLILKEPPLWPSTNSVEVAQLIFIRSSPGGLGVWGVSLRPLASWDDAFESRWGRNVSLLLSLSLSFVNAVCCQVELSTTDRSFVTDSDLLQQLPSTLVISN
jgi:hypothetical protein